jgi:Domain of unknown function (DUF5658)
MRGVALSPGSVRNLVSCAFLAALFLTCGAHRSMAQDINSPTLLPSYSLSANAIVAANPQIPLHFALPPIDLFSMPERDVTLSVDSNGRPGALVPLYVSFAFLQALDVASMRRAFERGAHEANPVLAPLVNSTPALVAIKAGSTAAIIYLTERLRKRHPVAAVLLMVGLNAGYASVVAHNYSLKGR